jgi:hypothetical protein
MGTGSVPLKKAAPANAEAAFHRFAEELFLLLALAIRLRRMLVGGLRLFSRLS